MAGRLILAAVLLVGAANCQSFEGEACTYQLTGQRGVCAPLETCAPAREVLKDDISPQTCSFQDASPVVCCPLDEDAPPTPTPTESPAAALRAPPPGNRCPSLPLYAVKVQPTGQKAWDKCIDLAQAVHPCVASSSLLLDPPKIRLDSCSHVSTQLIVGGSPTDAGEFPHMALLGFEDQPDIHWGCGGTLVSDLWVLSAGHCIFRPKTDRHVKYVRLGGDDKNKNATIDWDNLYNITKIVPHPEYVGTSKYSDLVLLQLDRKVIFTSLVRPACLHTGQTIDDTKAIATGWGRTRFRGESSESLLKVTLEKFSHADCALKILSNRKLKDGIRDESQVCFGHRTEIKDTCEGDSGGPLQLYNDESVYCTYLVIGVTSFGNHCGVKGQPAVYSRVSFFVPWIESVVWP